MYCVNENKNANSLLYFAKVNIEKASADNNKSMKHYPANKRVKIVKFKGVGFS